MPSDAAVPATKWQPTLQQQAAVFLVWSSANIGLNEFNSWAMRDVETPGLGGGGFKFGFFYTMFHMFATAMAALILMLTCSKPPPGGLPHLGQLWNYKYQLVPIAALTTVNYGLNNSSLVLIALFVNQAIKMTAPLPTAAFEFMLMGKVYNVQIYSTIAVLVAGCIASQATSFGESGTTQIKGVIFALISLLAATLGPVIKKIVMSGDDALGDRPALKPEQALFWDSLVAFVAMLIIWLAGDEFQPSMAYLRGETGNPNSGLLALGIIAFGASLAFVFNVAGYYLIHYTSALTSTIASNSVKIFLLVVSAFDATAAISGPYAWIAWLGITVASCAVVMYAYLQFQSKKAPTPANEKTPLAGQNTV